MPEQLTATLPRRQRRRAYYPYPGPPDRTEIAEPIIRGEIEITEVRFPSTLPSGVPGNDVVTARLFRRPDAEARRPVVLLPGMFGDRLAFWDSTAVSLAHRGFPTLLVGLPFLFERKPAEYRRGHPYVSIDPTLSLPAYEQAVADTRASLDWLLGTARSEGRAGGPRGPALVGVSLGAFIAVITCAMEPRFRRLVTVFGAGDLDAVVRGGSYGTRVDGQLDRQGVTDGERRQARLAYAQYLDRVREAKHPLDVRPTFHYFLFDPLTYAHHLRDLPTLMIRAAFDPVIPRDASLRLWHAMGRPEMSVMFGTHWPGGPWRSYIARRIGRFLSQPDTSREPSAGRARG
jgi:pimeloyl-ACP methyl ester carboxylesterase